MWLSFDVLFSWINWATVIKTDGVYCPILAVRSCTMEVMGFQVCSSWWVILFRITLIAFIHGHFIAS